MYFLDQNPQLQDISLLRKALLYQSNRKATTKKILHRAAASVNNIPFGNVLLKNTYSELIQLPA